MARPAGRRTRRLLLAAAALGALAGPQTARGNTPLSHDSTAVNVSRHGNVIAWSRRTPDGANHLVVRTEAGTLDATVAPSPVAFDPDVGPGPAGEPVVVYARPDGDLYRYRPGAGSEGVEQRLRSVSAPGTTEAAPSIYGTTVAFARLDGPRPGLYLSRLGRPARRLNATPPAETDLSATRVLWRQGGGAIRLGTLGGDAQRTVARVAAGEDGRVLSPTFSAAGPAWLRAVPDHVFVERLGPGGAPQTATRELPPTTTALTLSGGPGLFTDAGGVERVAPALQFVGQTAPLR